MRNLFFFVLFLALCFGRPSHDEYERALAKIDWNAVKQDIVAMFTNSQEFWPADYGNYGPFMIRQAWHCSGSYRGSDGRGGCDGGRQRFDPERYVLVTLLWFLTVHKGAGLTTPTWTRQRLFFGPSRRSTVLVSPGVISSSLLVQLPSRAWEDLFWVSALDALTTMMAVPVSYLAQPTSKRRLTLVPSMESASLLSELRPLV